MVVAGAGRLGSRSAGEDTIINDILSDGEPAQSCFPGYMKISLSDAKYIGYV